MGTLGGAQAIAASIGVAFGDGLRCAGVVVLRLGPKTAVAGASQYPGPTDPHLSMRGFVTTPGERFYQLWYRDSATFCTASLFNQTNGWRVTRRP